MEEEVNNTPSSERRSRVRQMLSGAHGTVALTDVAIARAQELKALGFRTYDAFHLACAEQATTVAPILKVLAKQDDPEVEEETEL